MNYIPTVTARGLVVDDDIGICQFACSVLRQEGYDVWSAGDAAEALRIASRATPPFEFLVTDLELGTYNGVDLVTAIRCFSPGTRLLMISGSAVSASAVRALVDGFLSKPFTPADLCQAIRDVLQPPETAPALLAEVVAGER